ncbi:MAG: hypothetical protein HY262_00805 [Chloroflexi bacterium]|nr:hypothetical protein [Chloroflexota bacterium]
MTQTLVREPEPPDATVARGEPELFVEQDMLLGRPLEDRSFEAVEATAAFAAGLAIGTVVAGPVGAVVGGLVGLSGGVVVGEAVERAVGRAATTTDAAEPAPTNLA